ncbi:hypothetical protein LTR37_002663 [Vermiconidia calcicola]|uniref:Uncharacterized protein n=1 Tax=Vermiconidia calcicola TaxID=1690605 RepID=A0ACC3NSD7_9PEZI|nr:hypothetical protein LTR37_002663 [Vermiconidia calcicola]
MADTAVKPEIKLDPATTNSPSGMADIDEFEEDTDLYIPAPPQQNGPTAWLVKVTPEVWQAWKEIYDTAADETPIEIGKMRVYHPKEGETPLQQRIAIRLTPGVPQHQDLPINYNVNLQADGYNNTVVFSEKDLPGHSYSHRPRSRQPYPQNQPGGLKPTGIRKPGTYRTAIPKQTALAPMIQHTADAQPVHDESYYRHFQKAYRNATKPKKTVTIQSGIDRGMHPGQANNLSTFTSFGLTSRPGRGGRKPAPKEKNVRVSQDVLLDRIYQCFRKYKYWSLKALKNELRQPETFIKETLQSIAVLIRSGDFAMNWKLKDEYADLQNIKQDELKDETALIKSEDEEGEEDEDAEMEGDEDAEEFEDVRMEGAPQPVDLKAVLAANKAFQKERRDRGQGHYSTVPYAERTEEQREDWNRYKRFSRARKKLEKEQMEALDE